MQILRSNLLLIAGSSYQGRFVAPKTRIRFPFTPTPSICTKNSVFTRLLDSLSPSLRLPAIESTQSMKIMLDYSFLAIANNSLTIFQLSPTYLLIISLLLTLKNVPPSISVAHALAMNVFPVPGGPYSKIPFQGFLDPVNIYGNLSGIITASFNAYFAFASPATSYHRTFGFSLTIACSKPFRISFLSLSAQLARIFLPSLFLMQSLIFLKSAANQSRVYLKADLSELFQSLRSQMNLRYADFALYL